MIKPSDNHAQEVFDIYYSNKILKKYPLDLSEDFKYNLDHTKFLSECDISFLPSPPISRSETKIEVVNESTTAALKRLSEANSATPIGVNFASSKSPGGGFLRGDKAQEEDLCRSSSLYFSLEKQKIFYKYYDLFGSMGTGNIIYSPKTVFFKDENYKNTHPFKADIITCAAPNLSQKIDYQNSDVISNILKLRIFNILKVANFYAQPKCDLVLGAWGCGIFANDPLVVSKIFKSLLKEFNFEKVTFAVLDRSTDQLNFNTFKKTFKDYK